MNDLILSENGDLSIKNGDFEIDFSDNKGEFKEFPEIGVGIHAMLGDDDYTDMLIEIKKNFEYDGMKIKNIRFDENGNLDIDGYYKNNG
jgi:hypothetical protein